MRLAGREWTWCRLGGARVRVPALYIAGDCDLQGEEVGFAVDSPLEETRFELPVPLSQTVCRILSNEGRSVPPSSAKNG